MYYTTKNANGDAGEYFFAYKIANELKWPCRLTGVDIGIDAQIEVMIDNDADPIGKISTGQFIAFQIKATSQEEKDCIYVDPKHIKYWKDLEIPVYVVLVDLSKPEMYVHYVDPARTYRHTKKRGQSCIEFNLDEDVFSSRTVVDFREKAGQSATALIDEKLQTIRDGVEGAEKQINDIPVGNNGVKNPTGKDICHLVDTKLNILEALNEVKSISKVFSIKKDEVDGVEIVARECASEIQNIVTYYNSINGTFFKIEE
ncbi:uncharacterized protein DUF4365 [Paraburkholderia unamae]|uniref:DUF4365 domain-containing protein n=1 Tax=Paraburkholderia unamae TaxID=219649 RepID=UPI000DC4AD95|nr:DUF4365 domain-containing protein [Paraburkholderia unamae]RAR67099.1 uncharacterized protein DUF4365 [Paraburkholderia unamae]